MSFVKYEPKGNIAYLIIDRAVVIEEKAFGSCFQSADQQEGMGAFLEKRKHEPFINK